MASLLVVDDEKLSRIAVRKVLERAGHGIVEATNGEEGLALLRRQAVDIVITDIVMPTMQGIETIAEIKREFAGLPVIAISGSGRVNNIDYLKSAQEAGADRVLAKPFSQRELIQAVDELLAGLPAARV